jgi:hypothetical protein
MRPRTYPPRSTGRAPVAARRGRRKKVSVTGVGVIMGLACAVAVLGVATIAIRHVANWTRASVKCTSRADGSPWADRVAAAARTGTAHGLRVGVAIVDTATDACYTAGNTDGLFATASVVKVMIAACLLDTDQMTADTGALAYSMITRSDDDAADRLWSWAGAAALEPWIEDHYKSPGLGSPNDIPGRWGNTHVTAAGLAQLYAKLKRDPDVWPWLRDAMHHMQRVAKDGTDQRFGIPAVSPGAAVKQGWAAASADDPGDSVVNSTGYVDQDRYAVVLLTEGRKAVDGGSFNPAQAATVTDMTRQLGLAV